MKPEPGMLKAARKKIADTWLNIIPDYPLNIESGLKSGTSGIIRKTLIMLSLSAAAV